jgi:hypothetical protein
MKLHGISSKGAKVGGTNTFGNTTLVKKPRKVSMPSISLAAWDKFAKKIESSRKSVVTKQPTFLHPWSVIIDWLPIASKVEKDFFRASIDPVKLNEDTGDKFQFHLQIMPGFINGTPPRIKVKAKNASADSRLRIENERKAAGLDPTIDDEEEIDVPLTEYPFLVVKKGDTRTIGVDPSVNITTDAGSLNIQAEKVPPLFKAMGVRQTDKSTVEIGIGGVKITDDEDDPEGKLTERKRYLRACDIVLKVERPSLKFDIEKGNPFLDGYSQLLTPRYARNAPTRKYATVFVTGGPWTPPPELTLEELESSVLSTPADPEYDYRKIATVHFISPFDSDSAEVEFTGNWQTEVKYYQFWNLCHMRAEFVSMLNPAPIRLFLPPTGAFGIAAALINSMLAPINDSTSRILARLRAKRMYGKFWST